ncbi:unnamed protein product, partial [Ixodes hexagonus]
NNTFISPSSIAAVLAMVYAGARGKSQEELSNVLGYSQVGLNSRDEVLRSYRNTLYDFQAPTAFVETANAALIQKKFEILQSYKRDLIESFATRLHSVDFEQNPSKVTSEINEWVKHKTHGMIPKMLTEDVDKDLVVVLLNAVYFKGTWHNAFNSSENRILPFYNEGTDGRRVETMRLTASFRHATLPNLKSHVVVLPYSGQRYCMVILLPDDRAGLSKLKQRVSVQELVDLPQKLKLKKVNVHLPKFELNTAYELKPILQALGVKSIFGTGADLSRMSGNRNLYVSSIKHKAAVKVNEEGTIAAAATEAEVKWRSSRIRDTVYFHVDHPFLFCIYDSATHRALFLGEVRKV